MRSPFATSLLAVLLLVGVAGAGCGDGGGSSEAAQPASARQPCTFGVDCLCDDLADDPDIAFCEDFENPDYNGYPRSRFGYDDGNPFALAYNSVNTDEGPCASCRYNIVASTDGQCDVPGERDCVVDGQQALGLHFVPGETGGIIGESSFEVGDHFGISFAFKYSSGFVDPAVALKTTEFGERNLSCLLGCSTDNAGSRNLPFGFGLIGDFALPDEVLVGRAELTDVGIAFNVDPAQYEWRGSRAPADDVDKVIAAPGHWVCEQIHVRDWGTDRTEIRGWINGKLALHLRGLDMRGLLGPNGLPSSDLEHIGFLAFNHYYNGGYPGRSPAYRYEDNFVITTADEPVPCATIAPTGL